MRSEQNLYKAFETSDLLPADFHWALTHCDASFLIRMRGESQIAELLKTDLLALQKLFHKIVSEHVGSPEAHLAMILRESTLTGMGTRNFPALHVLRVVCQNLQLEFCHLLTALAPRAMIENMSLLASLKNPPFPVAIWRKSWIEQAWGKFARSHGKRWYTRARAFP